MRYYFMVLIFLTRWNPMYLTLWTFPISCLFPEHYDFAVWPFTCTEKKPAWLWCQYWIKPNIAANTKNSGVNRNYEKSSYRTNCHVWIITVYNADSPYVSLVSLPSLSTDFWSGLYLFSSDEPFLIPALADLDCKPAPACFNLFSKLLFDSSFD